jgi:hypothetical protein
MAELLSENPSPGNGNGRRRLVLFRGAGARGWEALQPLKITAL